MKTFSRLTGHCGISGKKMAAALVMIFFAVSSLNAAQPAESSQTFIISGSVGIPDVEMRGLPGNPVTDSSGQYRVEVPFGWSGKVTPEKVGYKFEPASITYNKVTSNQNNQDYLSVILKYQISGTILSDKGQPVEGVVIESSGNAPVLTDNQGRYLLEVSLSSYGMIKPVGEKYTFSPAYIPYSLINRDIPNQNFKAQIRMLTISDIVQLDKNRPVQGVNVIANPGNIKTITDSRGQFSIQVPYGWSGDIFLSKPGLEIDSPAESYKNVTTDIINRIPVQPKTPTDFSITKIPPVQPQISEREGRKILIVPSGNIGPEEIAQIREDINVMAEIIDERFREPRLIEGVLRDFGDYFGRDNQQTEAIYIQGYGVIFMMEVNYQFSLLSQPDEKAKPDANNTDQTWEKARQRVLVPDAGTTGTQTSVGEYEKQMVNILKTELLRTLKYASNIRSLKPDEWIILSVAGSGASSAAIFRNYSGNIRGGYGGGMMAGGFNNSYVNSSGVATVSGGFGFGGYGGVSTFMGNSETIWPTASVMTIRVKKSDVDEFAGEKIDFEQFRQKVQILLH